MQDLYHYVGNDLVGSSTGDILTASDTVRGQQRVLRRLLTNPGEYIFHPEYGAGLGKLVGDTVDLPKIRALIRGQMLLEDAVAKSPEPQITVTEITGGVSVYILYNDSQTNSPVVLSFNVTV